MLQGGTKNSLVTVHGVLQLEEVYGEVFRVLKPGSYFASYEWVATKEYDPNNPEHVRIMDEINFGNGLPVSLRDSVPEWHVCQSSILVMHTVARE